MPVKPENRHLYRTPEYREACRIADERAGGRCEACGAPGGLAITRVIGTETPASKVRRMFWRWLADFGARGEWVNQWGESLKGAVPTLWRGDKPAQRYRVKVQLSHSHLNQDPSDNGTSNVAVLCGWCHINHDKWVITRHARQTRQAKKDAARPLIAAAMKGDTAHA